MKLTCRGEGRSVLAHGVQSTCVCRARRFQLYFTLRLSGRSKCRLSLIRDFMKTYTTKTVENVKVCEQEKRLAYKINCFLVSLTYMTSGLIILIEGINHLNIFADLISTRLTISWNVRISWKNGFFRK